MGWTLIAEKGLSYFQFTWENHYAFYTIKGNERKVLEKMNPLFLKQTHSNVIVDIDSSNSTAGDGLLTRKKDYTLGITVADCLPVYLFSKQKSCIIHCGWRGVIEGIAKYAARVMSNYHYVLGASIGPCCYTVLRDVAELFEQKYQHAIVVRGTQYYLDLKAAVIEDLGIKNLIGSLALCTHCHPDLFYSYRRGDQRERNYALLRSVDLTIKTTRIHL
jgi:YfiH family protein